MVILAAMASAIWVGMKQFEEVAEAGIPLAPVREGEFVAVIRTRGQIVAERSRPIYAPLVPDLRISWMAPVGGLLDAGGPMVRFDSSSAERDLIARRSALEQARANLDRAIVEAQVAAEHDERERVDARLAVELARLATAGSEFVGRIEAERAAIDLRLAEQNERQLVAEIEQRAVSGESRIASLRRQLEEAEAQVALIESRIAGMEIRAPISGYAIYATTSSSIAMTLTGQAQQPYRVGDQVSGGLRLATIPDLSTLLIDAEVEETDRGRLQVGNEVIVRVDALPGFSLQTKLSGISPLPEISSSSRGRSFHAYAALGEDMDERIRPGMNGSMDIVLDRVPDTRIVPAQSLFTRGGEPTLYVVDGGRFRPVDVEVIARNTDEVAVSGVEPGARVALIDPTSFDPALFDPANASGETAE
jgi:hypothetical protein